MSEKRTAVRAAIAAAETQESIAFIRGREARRRDGGGIKSRVIPNPYTMQPEKMEWFKGYSSEDDDVAQGRSAPAAKPSPAPNTAEQDAMWSAAYEPEIEHPPATPAAKTQQVLVTPNAHGKYAALEQRIIELEREREELQKQLRIADGANGALISKVDQLRQRLVESGIRATERLNKQKQIKRELDCANEDYHELQIDYDKLWDEAKALQQRCKRMEELEQQERTARNKLHVKYDQLQQRCERLLAACQSLLDVYGELHAEYDLGDCQATVDARAAIAAEQEQKP